MSQEGDGTPHVDRADRLADRLAVPVLIAALASVPAVFLTLMQGPWETAGSVLNSISGVVLIAETVVLFAVSDSRWEWVKRNRWLVGLTVVIVPAVIFAVGPVQLLRLVRVFGALRIIRVGRILKAGRILRERYGIDKRWQRAIGFFVTLLAASFVAIVLSDPTSFSRQFVDTAWSWLGPVGVILAGTILAVATFVVLRNKRNGAVEMVDENEVETGPDDEKR